MEFIPFYETINDEYDSVYLFKIKNHGDDNPQIYQQEIIIDGLNDYLIKTMTCSCKGYLFKKVKCKHLKSCLEELNKFGVQYRELSTEDKNK